MPQQRRIKFTHSGHAHLVGNFVAGDTFTGPADICAHYVDEACCAEWDDADAPVQAPADAAKPTRKKRGAAAADEEAAA
jgi:hypothetical protein